MYNNIVNHISFSAFYSNRGVKSKHTGCLESCYTPVTI